MIELARTPMQDFSSGPIRYKQPGVFPVVFSFYVTGSQFHSCEQGQWLATIVMLCSGRGYQKCTRYLFSCLCGLNAREILWRAMWNQMVADSS